MKGEAPRGGWGKLGRGLRGNRQDPPTHTPAWQWAVRVRGQGIRVRVRAADTGDLVKNRIRVHDMGSGTGMGSELQMWRIRVHAQGWGPDIGDRAQGASRGQAYG